MMESLTQDIADKAWELIEEIEQAGGMAKAIETGMPKLRIEEAAARKQARIDKGEDVIVGVNKYKVDAQDDVDVLEIDNDAVRESQVARLTKIRAERDESAVESILEDIYQCAVSGEGNLLELAIEATRRRASVGEISYAMEREFGRYKANAQTVSGQSTAVDPACWYVKWARMATTGAPRLLPLPLPTWVSISICPPCFQHRKKWPGKPLKTMCTWWVPHPWLLDTKRWFPS
jgi:hypothetical protein